MDRSSRQKNKETKALNDITDQTDLIDIYRTFHPKTACVSDHNAMRLEINCREKKRKTHKHMEAKQYVTK